MSSRKVMVYILRRDTTKIYSVQHHIKKATLRSGVCTGWFSAELHYGTLLDTKFSDHVS